MKRNDYLMKRLFSVVLLAAIFPLGLSAETKPQDPDALYAQAVASYVQGATVELKAIKTEVDASTKKSPAATKRFAPVKDKLAACEKLLGDLKTANQSNFDTIKSEYERTRGELVKALTKARQG